MPRPLWPPEYVNGSIHVLLDESVPDGAYRLYQKLRALSWGEETFSMNFDRLLELTGLSRTRIYEYARILRIRRGLLSYVVRDNAFECSFFPSGENPGKRDLPSPPNLSSETTINKGLKTKQASSRNPGKRETGNGSAGAGTNAIKDEYVNLLGYTPEDWVQGEATAAKEIGERYTVDQFRAAYTHFKAQEFWQDKRLSMRYLKTHIPEFLRFQVGSRRQPDDPKAVAAVAQIIERDRERVAAEKARVTNEQANANSR